MKTVVLSNEPILGSLYCLRVRTPSDVPSPVPGQFVHIACGESTTLRRPISVSDFDEGTKELTLRYDVRGKGTAYLSTRKPGDEIDMLEPFGSGFTVKEEERILLVGGGIGIYPLVFPAKLNKGTSIALLGFRTASLINSVGAFEAVGCEVRIITDDGTSGRKGFVTDLLREALQNHEADRVLVCGPMPMMAACAKVAEEFDVPCEVSLEERMACGVGACMGCACKIKADTSLFADGFTYKRVCKDGPVFQSKEVLWS